MSSEQVERKAVMNPDAVEEARVFSGLVYYFNGQVRVEIRDRPFVEVGKWTAAGNENQPEDYDCTYYAAVLLGYKDSMSWLPAEYGNPTEEERTGNRKLLIHKGNEKIGRIIPFSTEEADKVAEEINFLMDQVQFVKEEYGPCRPRS